MRCLAALLLALALLSLQQAAEAQILYELRAAPRLSSQLQHPYSSASEYIGGLVPSPLERRAAAQLLPRISGPELPRIDEEQLAYALLVRRRALETKGTWPQSLNNLYIHSAGPLHWSVQVYREGQAYLHLLAADPRQSQGGHKTFSRSIDLSTGELVANLEVTGGRSAGRDEAIAEIGLLEKFAKEPWIVALKNAGFFLKNNDDALLSLSIQSRLYDADLRDFRFEKAKDASKLLRVARKTLQALEQLHARGYVHRDVKPANFLISGRSGQPLEIVITDFGLSQSIEDQNFGRLVSGSRGYIAPEVCLRGLAGAKPLSSLHEGRLADLYSAGLLLYRSSSAGTGARLFKITRQLNLLALPKKDSKAPAQLQSPAVLQQQLLSEQRRLLALAMPAAGDDSTLRLWKSLQRLFLRMAHPEPEQRPSLEEVLDKLELLRSKGMA